MVNCSAKDILAALAVKDVHAWYFRLADFVSKTKVNGRDPLSAEFLVTYLAPACRLGPVAFNAPTYVRNHSIINDALNYHRKVYLTQEKARIGKSKRWVGIRPRWKDPAKYGWNGSGPITMHYTALVEVPIYWQITGSKAETDILHSLGLGFQLRTDVVVTVKKQSSGKGLNAEFKSFEARIEDRYNFNPKEHLTMPNPDYRSKEAGAICPRREKITVYHTNAARMVKSHLAVPYDLQSQTWTINRKSVINPGIVTL